MSPHGFVRKMGGSNLDRLLKEKGKQTGSADPGPQPKVTQNVLKQKWVKMGEKPDRYTASA